MAVTLPGRDRERLIRTLAPSTHLQTHPLRPALPPRDRKRLAHPLAASAHSQAPLSRRPALPRATENGFARAFAVSLPFAGPSPSPTCASPRDRKRLVRALAAFAHRRPAPRRPALPRATANVPARGFSQAPGDGLRPSGMALAVPPRHVGQKMFKFYNSLKIALSPVDSGMRACYNVPSGYPVVCATPVLLPTDSKKDSGSVSVDVMPPISDRPGKAANGRRSPPCLSGG